MNLIIGVQHSVEAASRIDIKPAIGQDWNDLARWYPGEFGLVVCEQDPLTFFLAETVRDMAVGAFALGDAITVTSELPTPTLQSAQLHAQMQRQLPGTKSCGHSLIQDCRAVLGSSAEVNHPRSLPQEGLIFFESTSTAAASAKTLSLWRSFCCSRLFSRWSPWCHFWSSFLLAIVSSGCALAFWAAWRQRATRSGNKPRLRQ